MIRGAGSSFSTSRPVAVLVVFVAAVVFGWFSYGRLAVTLMPELSYPTLTVRTEYAGAAPQEVEHDVSQPIEETLGVITGLRRISSISRAGVSDVVLEMSWETEISAALQDALEKLDLVILPEGAGPSLILRYDPSLDPVMELSLSSARPDAPREKELRRLRRIAEQQIKRALEPIKGVAAVRVRGGLEEEIHVSLIADRVTRAGLSITDVIQKLEQENVNIAGGTVKEGRTDYMVRTVNEFVGVEQIADTVIATVEDRDIRLRDLGEVTQSHKERQMSTRTDGGESVQIDIFKEADANIVALSERIRRALGELDTAPREPDNSREAGAGGGPGRSQPRGLAAQIRSEEEAVLTVVADRSLFVRSAIREVQSAAVMGGLLAVVVLFLFIRNIRPTLVIAVSIPVSLLITFAPLNLLGVSLNIMSLGGLALGVGMLVDSSIVVLESIARCREEGDDVVAAAVRGTREVRGAVIASILTTIGVFLPMVFVEGVAGQAFADLGFAVVFSLLASLVVALSLIPMLASRQAGAEGGAIGGASWRFASVQAFRDDIGRTQGVGRLLVPYLSVRFVLVFSLEAIAKLVLLVLFALVWSGTLLARRVVAPAGKVVLWLPMLASGAVLSGGSRLYPRVLRWCLAHTPAVLGMLGISVAIMVLAARELQTELLPEVHQGEFTIELALPIGTPLEETELLLGQVEAAILDERDQIHSLLVTYGYDPTNSQRSDEGEHTARFKLLLEAASDNAAAEDAVAGRLREKIAAIPDLESRLVRPVLFSFRTPIEVEIYGDDLPRLREMADRAAVVVAAIPLLADVESTLRPGAPEVQIVYDREKLRRFGLNIAQVARMMRDEVKGREATRFKTGDRRVPIVVRMREQDRLSVDMIRQRIIDPDRTGSIRLSSVADVGLGAGPSEIRRVDGRRVAILRANLAAGASLGAGVVAIERELAAQLEWPNDLSFEVSGQSDEWERSESGLWLALALSVFLVYVIMAAQFESLWYPLIILVTIPLALFGSFVTLWALDINLSIVVFLGMIMLAGIVVNNAIVLVDYINQLKARGRALADAVVEAGTVRLRPILMTTATTVLGLVPMAIGLGDGAEIRTPLAITVISGLVASTALTLIVIPTIYALVDRTRAWLFGAPRARTSASGGDAGADEL